MFQTKRTLSVIAVVFLLAEPLLSQPRELSLDAAIAAALGNNAEIQLSEERTIQAKTRVVEQRAQLLPNTSAAFAERNQSINLAALGIPIPNVPLRVGPFGVADLRIRFSEPLFDLPLIRRYQASQKTRTPPSMIVSLSKMLWRV